MRYKEFFLSGFEISELTNDEISAFSLAFQENVLIILQEDGLISDEERCACQKLLRGWAK